MTSTIFFDCERDANKLHIIRAEQFGVYLSADIDAIVHNTSYNSTIHVNGNTVVISRGSVFNYESDGSSWNLVTDYSFSVVRAPKEQGVPVTTLLGYFDPENILPSYVYSALHGAYGNIFHSDREIEVKNARCYAEVMNDKGQALKFV